MIYSYQEKINTVTLSYMGNIYDDFGIFSYLSFFFLLQISGAIY